jgi:hypothetical protein
MLMVVQRQKAAHQASRFGVGFRRSASLRMSPATTSGAGPKASGIARDNSASRSTRHFEYPPIIGELIAKTTRLIGFSRTGNEHIAQDSTLE